MWPFSDHQVSSSEHVVTRAEFDDICRRLKLIERESDDLHAAYRRLRGSKAADLRQNAEHAEASPGPEVLPGNTISHKDELRRKHLSALHRGPAQPT